MSDTVERLIELKNCLGIACIASGNHDIYADDGELSCMLRLIYSSLEKIITECE